MVLSKKVNFISFNLNDILKKSIIYKTYKNIYELKEYQKTMKNSYKINK